MTVTLALKDLSNIGLSGPGRHLVCVTITSASMSSVYSGLEIKIRKIKFLSLSALDFLACSTIMINGK